MTFSLLLNTWKFIADIFLYGMHVMSALDSATSRNQQWFSRLLGECKITPFINIFPLSTGKGNETANSERKWNCNELVIHILLKHYLLKLKSKQTYLGFASRKLLRFISKIRNLDFSILLNNYCRECTMVKLLCFLTAGLLCMHYVALWVSQTILHDFYHILAN